MASPETKRCLYEILNLSRDCTPDEIKSSYRKLALQRHPDKLIKSGITEAEATASFQELQNAYQILSDARERAWYDSHRSQILFSNSNTSSSSSGPTGIPDLFSYFSNSVFNGFSDASRGFYKVYSDVFDRIYRNELRFASALGLGGNAVKEAPLMGNLGSEFAQVNAFYGYWLGFVTVMDFVWADEYDAMNGPNRKSRRLMEDENKKIRKKAKREYNETVRGLAEFVKKRDKRVIDMQMKRNEEIERKREEEKVRRKEIEKAKAERARAYEVPDWAKVEGEEDVEEVEEEVEEERRNEFYCVACGKKFKSDKQWKNHEQSKKHKEKIAELRDAFSEEDREIEDDEEEDGFVSVDEVEKLKEEFESVEIRKEESESEEEFVDVENGEKEGDDNENEDDDDEDSVLKAMLKNSKKAGSTRKQKAYSKNVYVEEEAEEVDLMLYNNTKGRRNRRGRKETAKREEHDVIDKPEGTFKRAEHEEQEIIDKPEVSSKPEVEDKCDDGSGIEEPSASEARAEKENNGEGKPDPTVKMKVPKQAPTVKVTNKKEVNSKPKNSSKAKKQKEKSRNSGHECDTCGVDFDSRNKLHKHLSDTGHAALKSR